MTPSSYVPQDRRPIQSRETRWAQGAAGLLATWGVTPNAISLTGLMAATLAGVAFGCTGLTPSNAARLLWSLGGILCQIRLLCNLFDGMVAVRRGIASPQGELYNEVPDRLSDAAVFIGLGYSVGGHEVAGYLAALVSLFVAYVRVAAKSMGAPHDFCGPMAKPHRMALTTVTALWMACAPEAWASRWHVPALALWLVCVGGVTTAVRRLMRAARHLEGPAK